jgi:hypothetical protein
VFFPPTIVIYHRPVVVRPPAYRRQYQAGPSRPSNPGHVRVVVPAKKRYEAGHPK